jgi:hypothetical protein
MSLRDAARTGQEVIASGGSWQSAGPALHVGVGEDENLSCLNPYALVRHISRTRREVQMLDESKSGPINANR